MSILRWGVRFYCDMCGNQGDATPLPEGQWDWREIPSPEGWRALDLLGLQLTDVFASRVQHLCPVCAQLSIGELTDRLKDRMAKGKTDG